jgi:hypothetical protein
VPIFLIDIQKLFDALKASFDKPSNICGRRVWLPPAVECADSPRSANQVGPRIKGNDVEHGTSGKIRRTNSLTLIWILELSQ